jgi:hypothetical protein
MRAWITLAAGFTLLASTTAVPATGARAKEPPQPAFGKELVPDQQAQKDPKAAEIEEELHDKEDGEGFKPARRAGGGHGKRVHIQLDGDEDGGGDGESGDF